MKLFIFAFINPVRKSSKLHGVRVAVLISLFTASLHGQHLEAAIRCAKKHTINKPTLIRPRRFVFKRLGYCLYARTVSAV